MNTRRKFLIQAPLAALVGTATWKQALTAQTPSPTPTTAGAPPTFGTGPGSGPPVTPQTFAEAEKLMQVTMTPAERQQAADTWRTSLAQYLERRTGPRKVAIKDSEPPATLWNPMLPGIPVQPARDQFVRSRATVASVPSNDEDIAFAPVTQLSRWIESSKLTSERLTNIYLKRIERFDPNLRAIITLTKDHALARAKQADAEIADGEYRGPLHGIPYGVKDLLDTKDIPTTYGAEPVRHRLPSADSFVVRRLNEAGAVLLDKLGPMTRSVEDALLVLYAISGADIGDPSSVPSDLDFNATGPVVGLRVGYIAPWMKEAPATDVDSSAMETMKKLGMRLQEVTLPDWPYSSLMPILFAEGAASFEELALNNQLRELKVQAKDAWPNLFGQSGFLSPVDFVQADRWRRKVALEMARVFKEVDLLIVPSLRDEQLTITNFTGHPSLTMRAGFVEVSEARSDWAPDPANPLPRFNPPRRVPHGITILGRLFDDGLLGQVGVALEKAFNVVKERPR